MNIHTESQRGAWVLLLAALLFFAAAWSAARLAKVDEPYILWCVALLLLLLSLPSFSVFIEIAIFPLLYPLFAIFVPLEGSWVSFPLVVMTLTSLAHPLSSRLARILAVLGALLWLDLPTLLAAPPETWVAYLFIGGGLSGILLFMATSGATPSAVKKIDLLLCSYTGNTAHFARAFSDGATRAGAQVTEHRFHYYKGFESNFKGDALVIAYPVAGWNPFWPVLEYLLFKLPRGNGKPAFILSSSAGGPENSHLVPWLALWLRGYRVMGRLGAIYPVNVPMFRLFSATSWRIFDAFLPRASDLRLVERAAEAFCQGRRSGFALTVIPCLLFILGPLTYNRFINYIYRSYSFKRLCNQCGRCIRFCPSERLYWKNGRVRSKGTCALCFGCNNICPTQAVQLLFFTEWGNAYRPRFPKLVVKRKPKPKDDDQGAPTAGQVKAR